MLSHRLLCETVGKRDFAASDGCARKRVVLPHLEGDEEAVEFDGDVQ